MIPFANLSPTGSGLVFALAETIRDNAAIFVSLALGAAVACIAYAGNDRLNRKWGVA